MVLRPHSSSSTIEQTSRSCQALTGRSFPLALSQRCRCCHRGRGRASRFQDLARTRWRLAALRSWRGKAHVFLIPVWYRTISWTCLVSCVCSTPCCSSKFWRSNPRSILSTCPSFRRCLKIPEFEVDLLVEDPLSSLFRRPTLLQLGAPHKEWEQGSSRWCNYRWFDDHLTWGRESFDKLSLFSSLRSWWRRSCGTVRYSQFSERLGRHGFHRGQLLGGHLLSILEEAQKDQLLPLIFELIFDFACQ